jgi:hypothetical protein
VAPLPQANPSIAADLPLRVPRKPPDISIPEAIVPIPQPADQPSMAVTAPPQAAPQQPDPADAIDWLLNKRRQQTDP